MALLDIDAYDNELGSHHHIDSLYVAATTPTHLRPDLAEVLDAAWVATADLPSLDTPPEIPVFGAAGLAHLHRHRGRSPQ